MYARKLKRKCSVRGCRNTESFAIACSREVGNTVIICKSCMENGLKAIENYSDRAKDVKMGEIPQLFFNQKALGVQKTTESESETLKKPKTDTTPAKPKKTANKKD